MDEYQFSYEQIINMSAYYLYPFRSMVNYYLNKVPKFIL